MKDEPSNTVYSKKILQSYQFLLYYQRCYRATKVWKTKLKEINRNTI